MQPFGSRELLSEAQRRAVDALAEAVSSVGALSARWAAEQQLLEPDDRVRLWIGMPDEDALKRMAASYEQRFRSRFPVDLAYTLSRFNGIAIASEPEAGIEEVAPADLPEPSLWPAEVYGDHFTLVGSELDRDVGFYVIGEIPDSGHLALGVRTGEDRPSGVYWFDIELSASEPVRIADGFADLLLQWCDAALCLPLLLTRSGVPGWT